MTIKNNKHFFSTHPVATGAATVFSVFALGVGIALSGGFVAPNQIHAEVPTFMSSTDMLSTDHILQMAGVDEASSASGAAAAAGSASAAASAASDAIVSTSMLQNGSNQTLSLNVGAGSGSGSAAAASSGSPAASAGSAAAAASAASAASVSASLVQNGSTSNLALNVGAAASSGSAASAASGSAASSAAAAASAASGSTAVVVSTAQPTCVLTHTGASAIAWSTSGATAVTIDGAAVASAGSVAVASAGTTTYHLTATNSGGTVNCTTTVVVPPPSPNAPTCVLTASPTTLLQGSAGSLIWNTSNATSVTISNIGTVALDGSKTIAPTQTTTYTLTATGNGGTVNCVTTVTIVPPTYNPVPSCTLTTSANNITNGGSVTLYWTGTNVNSFVIDQGVGSVSPNSGSVVVYPGSSRTYTAIATGPNGSVTCATSVSVNTYYAGGPTCTLSLADYTIEEGQQTTLRWDSSNTSSVNIDNGIGNVGQNGVRTVAPRAGIYTYQGTFYGYNGQTITCLATLRVNGYVRTSGGGSSNVTLEQLPSVAALPLSSLALADLPYTGLDLGPVGTVVYWLALIIWSLAFAYLIFWSLIPLAYRRMALAQAQGPVQGHAHPIAYALPSLHDSQANHASVAPAVHAPEPKASAYEGFKSSVEGAALSIDDIVNGLSRQSSDAHEMPVAHVQAPVQNTWTAPVAQITHEETTSVAYAAAAPVAAYAPTRSTVSAGVPAEVPAFLTALLAAEKDQVFGMIREMNKAGQNVEEFLTHVVVALDDAYRAKIDGTPVHPEVARVCANCAPSFLERVIASLTTVVDGSYMTGVTGVKLALTRALQSVEG